MNVFACLAIAAFCGACVSLAFNSIFHWYQARKAKAAEPNELDTLVRQERINQAIPLVTMIATHLPVDVGSITITLHYSATESLTMECGRPQRMAVET